MAGKVKRGIHVYELTIKDTCIIVMMEVRSLKVLYWSGEITNFGKPGASAGNS